MSILIVQAESAEAAKAAVPTILHLSGVEGARAYSGLRRFVEVKVREHAKHSVISDLRFVRGVVDVADGDIAAVALAQETRTVALGTAARKMPPGAAQAFHYWGNTGRRNPVPPWTQLPRSVEYARETARLGANVIVSVHDTGIDSSHTAEFGARVTEIFDAVEDGPGNHGTGVASVVAGATCGFLPQAQLLDAKCFSSGGSGSASTAISSLDALLTWVASNVTDEHVIVNLSFGVSGSNVYAAIIDDIEDAGIAMFAGSGNFDWNLDGLDNFWPAEGLTWGAVGAVNLAGDRLHFSSVGSPVRFHGLGWHVPTALTGGGYGWQSGTSFACPAVAGCYGTWAASREAPRSRAEVHALLAEFHAFCRGWPVDQRPYDDDLLSQNAVVARADNSPVA